MPNLQNGLIYYSHQPQAKHLTTWHNLLFAPTTSEIIYYIFIIYAIYTKVNVFYNKYKILYAFFYMILHFIFFAQKGASLLGEKGRFLVWRIGRIFMQISSFDCFGSFPLSNLLFQAFLL